MNERLTLYLREHVNEHSPNRNTERMNNQKIRRDIRKRKRKPYRVYKDILC